MRSTLDELERDLEELESFAASIEPVNRALGEHQDSLVHRYLSVRRRFDHAAFIVALYSSFEKFLEDLARSYAHLLAQRTAYTELPEKLREKHTKESAGFLAAGRSGQARYRGITESDVVKNLYECLMGTEPYSLNGFAVVEHDANLRYDEVNRLFANVGIDEVLVGAAKAQTLRDWQERNGGNPVACVRATEIKERINDLVERRNDVAHRGGRPDDILGATEMRDRIEFMGPLCKSIFTIVVREYLDTQVKSGRAGGLRLLGDPLKGGSVVLAASPTQPLRLHQPIFALSGGGVHWGRITSLQKDGEEIEATVKDHPGPGVGIGLDFKCPRNASLYTLDDEDNAVWPPLPPTQIGAHRH